MSIAATASDSERRRRESVTRATRASTPGFDWTMTLLSAVFVGGLYLDGWAHTHGRVDETFFTPWHAALYSGFLATALCLWGGLVWGVRRGHPWRAALPDGYGLSLLGVAMWFAGGPFDFAWHAVFGFEVSVEALMSPAHAVLALGFALITSGPMRAILRRRRDTWWHDVPLALSLTFVVSVLTFFTQIAHPLTNLWAAGGRRSSPDVTELGLVGFLLTTAVLVGPMLFLLRHGRLSTGSVTILVGLNSVAMGFLFDHGDYPRALVAASTAAGVAADLVRVPLRPEADRPAAFRVYAGAVPLLLVGAYFAGLALTTGIAWSPHLWMGTVVFCGIVGWLLSYLVLPPRLQPGLEDRDPDRMPGLGYSPPRGGAR
jgi:hypothetical protein